MGGLLPDGCRTVDEAMIWAAREYVRRSEANPVLGRPENDRNWEAACRIWDRRKDRLIEHTMRFARMERLARKYQRDRDDLLEACKAALADLDEDASCYHRRAIPILVDAIARAESESD